MALILSIETATSVCSIALHQAGVLLGKYELYLEKSHSSMLTAMIDQLMQNTDKAVNDLQAVAVSKGPGSYTGLRIGLATAKGLCFGLNIPLIGVNTLQGLLQQVLPYGHQVGYYCPMLDARRMEVYSLVADNKGITMEDTTATVVNATSYLEYLSSAPVLFFGNGAAKCKEVIKNKRARFLEGVSASAADIGQIAYESYKQEMFEDVAYFEPFYLKEFKTVAPTRKSGL